MNKLSLNGIWKLDVIGGQAGISATVPGSVYNDLIENGFLEDPYFRANEEIALPVMENDFLYQRTFFADETHLGHDLALLRMDGLDTLADVRLNGRLVLRADNMHRIWEADVTDVLRAGENKIEILLKSPTKFIRAAYEKSPYEGSSDAMRGFVHLRKAHCMFGWDWGIRLPDCGIWRDIGIRFYDEAKIEGVYIRQRHAQGRVFLNIEADAEYITSTDIRFEAEITAPDGETFFQTDAEAGEIEILNPKLWWPNGYGDQPLYDVNVTLKSDDGRTLDTYQHKIGLRTLTMHIEKDQWGTSFAACVNGVDVFSMGADYIPEDAILPRVTRSRTRRLLEDAVLANHNCVRVWGGGHYPSDDFYELCDELGLMVWQDFMFACASYELTDAFEENIRAEFRDNIVRLRNHPSLALWCGNNEMEQFAAMGVWVESPKQKSEYIRMYEYIIPKMLKEYDPDTFYWPASPSSTGSFDDPNDENRGDVHYWMVWHGELPFTAYRDHYFRYASEFGFQAYPTMPTIRSFTQPADRNAFSYVMEKHQRNAAANGKIMKYVAQMYLYPKDFASLVYTSQMLQADAIRYGVEHWRRNRGRCMGAVVWQLNDNWPVISWASIDYYGRWKALHYFEKRFFAPVLLSACEEGELTGRPDVNIELKKPVEKTVRFNLSNETMAPALCVVKWSRRDARAKALESGELCADVPALSAHWFDALTFADMDIHGEYISYELWMEGACVSQGTTLLVAPKHFAFVDPALSAKVEGNEIVVTALAYAKGVMIESADPDMLVSDNFFDMDAGERRVKILRGEAEGLRLRSVYDIADREGDTE